VAKLPLVSTVSTTPAANFATSFTNVVEFATGVNDTGGKFAADVDNTGINDTSINGTVINRTGVNDTGGKVATSVNDTSGKQWD
jgi:hypothetical protein